MLRSACFLVLAMGFLASNLRADETPPAKMASKGQRATVTNLDSVARTITVRLKDASGKEDEKTYKLTDDVTMLSDDGQIATIDVFQIGQNVLVLEERGKLVRLQKARAGQGAGDTSGK